MVCDTGCVQAQEEKYVSSVKAKIPKKSAGTLLYSSSMRNDGKYREHGEPWKRSFSPDTYFDHGKCGRIVFAAEKIIGLTKLLGTGNEITALTESETAFLKKFGGEEQIVRMSEGIIEGSRTKILSGPLMGMEGQIRKIDRHKRKAWLEVEMFGRTQLVEIGLEITMKRI